ncbi:DUF421 domain-containing protein [Alicyclobacillaceae bacterium I2511]|nr:DUF421 domain-containing protein [Alicyclobacillaceae bacterium I2511]
MLQYLEIVLRSVFAFAVLLILARVLGKRQMAQLTFFDYIVGITIGNMAASLAIDDVKVSHALLSLALWTVLSILMALIQRGFYISRVWLDGRPTVLIEGGKVMDHGLHKVRISIEEMMLMLRGKDIFDLNEVDYAVLEVNGKISARKKPQYAPITPNVSGLPVAEHGTPRMVIIDGNLMERSLRSMGLSKEWLLGELRKQGAEGPEDVFLAQITSDGSVYADLYKDNQAVSAPQDRPLVAATLKKAQADLEAFALATDNPQAKRAYARQAAALKKLLEQLAPYLRG